MNYQAKYSYILTQTKLRAMELRNHAKHIKGKNDTRELKFTAPHNSFYKQDQFVFCIS